jgi:ribonuclease HI
MSQCVVCSQSFRSRQAMLQHCEQVHGRSSVHKGVLAWERNRNHVGAISTGKSVAEYSYEVDDDQYDYETDSWVCQICSKSFREQRHLYQHLSSGTHESDRYVCHECDRRFKSLSGLNQHLEMTGHSRREERLVHTLVSDTQRMRNLPMITNGPAISAPPECILYFDGGAQPNPGYGGCGWYLLDDRGLEIECRSEPVREGSCDVTNNEAEYRGLINGMQAALDEHVRRLLVRGDSELVINQMRGVYECRHPNLTRLHAEARRLAQRFHAVQYERVARAANAVANRLATDAVADSRAAAGRAVYGGREIFALGAYF